MITPHTGSLQVFIAESNLINLNSAVFTNLTIEKQPKEFKFGNSTEVGYKQVVIESGDRSNTLFSVLLATANRRVQIAEGMVYYFEREGG